MRLIRLNMRLYHLVGHSCFFFAFSFALVCSVFFLLFLLSVSLLGEVIEGYGSATRSTADGSGLKTYIHPNNFSASKDDFPGTFLIKGFFVDGNEKKIGGDIIELRLLTKGGIPSSTSSMTGNKRTIDDLGSDAGTETGLILRCFSLSLSPTLFYYFCCCRLLLVRKY
jgi:hypothetical protein